VHHYRGVFGSHLGNLIRRLKRICKFHGSTPQFICCSATIANPLELTEKLLEEDVVLVDNNGAPSGTKHFLFYNPPVINQQLGIRKSSVNEVQKLAGTFIGNGVQTIVFAPSRLKVEVLLNYLKESAALKKLNSDAVCGYRGGYLPNERRRVESGLRSGRIKGVVSTNALELGIDIGQLDACLMAGYPGNISSTWQQAGRAGRRQDTSVAVLVANSSPLDQYLMSHPEYFFSKTPEHGVIDPNNLIILTSHIKCAAFELPFQKGEKFGVDTTEEILQYLEQNEVLHFADDKWHWNSEIYPAEQVSLRSASPENFVVLNTSDNNQVIGEVDYFSAPIFLFPDAIYLHQGRQYQVQELDWDGKKAYVKEADVDFYTDCETKTEIKVLHKNLEQRLPKGEIFLGEISTTTAAVLYKKIRFHTHENIGSGRIHLPELEMHTTAFWYQLPEDIAARLGLSQHQLGGALRGLSRVLSSIASLWVMCDPRDIRTYFYLKAPLSGLPTIYLYDYYPGGVGFAEKVFQLQKMIWSECKNLIESCPCPDGCPSCVGPVVEVGEQGKGSAIQLLDYMMV
jgi:DEAD/DEAH box helicase domain-containing protein